VTLFAQKSASALQTVTTYPLSVRLGNALVSYVWYLKAMIWPAGLAVFYPHPMTTQDRIAIVVAALLLVAICGAVVATRKTLPFLTFGWTWYAGTLLPVAGIIQVGSQAYADRYAYVPLIGIFVIVVWSALKLSDGRSEIWRQSFAGAGVVWVIALAVGTRAQLPYWHDSVSLFQRAVDAVPDNALAHNNLGMALIERNKIPEARDHFKRATEIAPWDTDALSNLGNAQRATAQPAEAQKSYAKALEQAPNDASIHYNLATALIDLKKNAEAIIQLNKAITLDPNYKKAHYLLGSLLYQSGRKDDALAQFHEVQRIDPTDRRAAEAIGVIEEQKSGK
jgi:tetratricopeptide (TPR) repeat protein